MKIKIINHTIDKVNKKEHYLRYILKEYNNTTHNKVYNSNKLCLNINGILHTVRAIGET